MLRSSTLGWRALTAGAAVVAALGFSGCAIPGTSASSDAASSDWRSEPRCQPPGGGWEPWQVLPDREKCPEAYQGSGNPGSAPGLPAIPGPGTTEPYKPSPAQPCSTVPSLNGFRCENVDPYGNPGPYYPPYP